MRNFVMATAAVAMIGVAGSVHAADTVDLVLEDMDTITAGSYYKNFATNVGLHKNIGVNAYFYVNPYIRGNVAVSEGYATAAGSNSFTEVLNTTNTLQGGGSESFGHAISATGPYKSYHW